MALLDLVDKNTSRSLSSKWSISLFTGRKRGSTFVPKSEIAGMSKEDTIELHMEIAQLQQALGKYVASNERKSGSARASLNELEQFIKELRNSNSRPDFINQAYQVKDSLLNTMDKFDNNNWKAVVEAAKTRRDIRKYYLDKNKQAGGSVIDAAPVEERGPIGTLNVYAGGANQVMPVLGTGYTPNIVKPQTVNMEQTPTTPKVEVAPAPQQLKLDKEETPSIPASGLEIHTNRTVVHEGMLESQNITAKDLNADYIATLKSRSNMTLDDAKGNRLGHDFNTSINGMMAAADNPVVRMYINEDDGSYYPKCYYSNPDGTADLSREYPYFNQPSIIHMDGLELEPDGKHLKCFAFKNPLEYDIVQTDADMPQTYKNYWGLPENQGYMLSKKDIEIIKMRRS